MNFAPIIRLRLKDAFGDQKVFQVVSNDSDYLNCLFEWTDRGTVFIIDDADIGHSAFIFDTRGLGTDKTFKVINRSHKDLFLWHIDGVLYYADSKCDCALLTDDYLGFVEFKSNAANNTEASIKGNYEKAKLQLTQTIRDVVDRCKKLGVELQHAVNVEAFAVFNRTVPRHNAYQKKLAAQFLLETDGIPLYFKNNTEV